MTKLKNTVCWADIPVLDLDRAITFYSKLLKKEVLKVEDPFGAFGLLPHENDNVSGCLTTESKPSAEGIAIYLDVSGFIDEAIEIAKDNGGSSISQKQEMGPYGTRAAILDSEGNRIMLYQAPEISDPSCSTEKSCCE